MPAVRKRESALKGKRQTLITSWLRILRHRHLSNFVLPAGLPVPTPTIHHVVLGLPATRMPQSASSPRQSPRTMAIRVRRTAAQALCHGHHRHQVLPRGLQHLHRDGRRQHLHRVHSPQVQPGAQSLSRALAFSLLLTLVLTSRSTLQPTFSRASWGGSCFDP